MLRPLAGAAAGAAAACAFAGVPAPPANASTPPAPTPATLLAAAGRAVAAQTRVHLDGVMSQVMGGKGVYVSVGIDAGAAYGTLSETIASNGRRVRFGAVLTPARAYCTGDPDAVAAGCALTPARAAAAAGRWLSFAPGTVAYRAVAAMVQFRHDLYRILPAPQADFAVLRRARLGGQAVTELRGPASASAGFPAGTVETLALAATGPPLPVAVEMLKPGRVDEAERFSRWGMRFTVHVPHGRRAG